jgi:hypothetical protein
LTRWRHGDGPGREPTITIEAKVWLVDLACRKARDFAYPHDCGRRGFSPPMPARMDLG